MAADTSNVILGSGKLYITELSNGEIPESYENDCVGDISGGAEIEYKPTIKEVKNDFQEVRKAFVTSEEVKLKSGVLTWNLETMAKLTVGAKYTAKTGSSNATLTLGGISEIKQYGIVFVHEKDNGAKIIVKLKGYNGSGFKFSFDPEKETVLDAEFTATKQSDKTLVKIEETEAAEA